MNNNKQRLANRFLYKLALGVYGNGFAKRHLTIDRSGLQDTKPPYIVLSTHASNADVFGTAVALTPQVLNFVASIDQLVGFHFIKERLGLIPKRQFTVDLSLVRLIKSVTDKGRGVAIFPEGKLSVDGRNSVLAVNLGKLAKVLRLPIVTAH
ncbi:MAG: 1-acyl-sn-glycerol-3-phosphate acyltransferase, partial [Clostridia bacterium]